MLRCFFYIAISAVSIIYSQECQDISANYYGDCELQIGYGWDGDACISIFGCDVGDDENIIFDSFEECAFLCVSDATVGDVNNDQYIDILDIVLLINIVLGNHNPDQSEIYSGDINSDSLLDILDIVQLVNSVIQNSQDDRDTWDIIYNDIIYDSCVSSCHASGTYFAEVSGLELDEAIAYQELIDVSPENSYADDDGLVLLSSEGGLLGLLKSFLWEKINIRNHGHYYDEHPYYGEIMPLGGPYLSNGELAFIEKWIMEGAPEQGIVADTGLLFDTTVFNPEEFTILDYPAQGFQLHIEPFAVQPNSEREILYYIPPLSSDDIYINRFEISMRPGSHHFLVYTFNDGIPSEYMPDYYEVRDLYNPYNNNQFWSWNAAPMLYHKFVGGTQWPYMDYSFPEGVALRLPPTFGLDLNSHYANGSNDQIYGEVYANIHTLPEWEVEHVAEILVLNNTDITLPPNQITTLEKTYNFNQILSSSGISNSGVSEINIFQMFTHAHKHLIRFDIELLQANGESELIYTTLDWEHPPILRMDPPLTIVPGQKLKLIATYDNWEDEELNFGVYSEDEMMILFGYLYTE